MFGKEERARTEGAVGERVRIFMSKVPALDNSVVVSGKYEYLIRRHIYL